MRPLQLTRDFPPPCIGGISTAVFGLVEQLTRTGGAEAWVVSFDGWRRSKATTPDLPQPALQQLGGGTVPVLRLRSPDQLPALLPFANDARPDLVHLHDALLWPSASAVARRFDIPVVYTPHVLQAHLSALRGLADPPASQRAEDAVFADCDRILAPSPSTFALLSRDPRCLDERLDLVPLGVAATTMHARPPARPTDAARLLFVGRYADVNGIAELIDVIVRLAERFAGLTFSIAGGLPESPKRQRRWQRRFAGALSRFADRVHLPGWLDREALDAELATASCLIAPSWFETFGLVVLEAMQRGVPIVACRVGALADWLEHGRNAVLCAPRDVDCLTEAVSTLLDDRPLALRLAQTARADSQHHRWEDRVEGFVRAYRGALKR